MELSQRLQLKRTLVPQLAQSLNILALPLLDIKGLIENELESNPLLERSELGRKIRGNIIGPPLDFQTSLITKKCTLQEILLRQLGMFTSSDEDFKIGQEIIGNIDENGYLKAGLDEIAAACNTSIENAEKTLKLIQDFEPAGIAARSISECLLIQLRLSNKQDPLLVKLIENHLEDVAKKNYSLIAKTLKEPLEKIQPLIKKILRLDPKPGRNLSADETQSIIPDIIIEEKGEDYEIIINDEDTSILSINKDYQEMLKQSNLKPQAKEFLEKKLNNAMELLRAISKRHATLRKVMETVLEIQQDAVKENLSYLKPLTFGEVARKLDIHESTVCRAVMNKYVKTPYCGVVALKNFFTSRIHDQNGGAVSSSHIKGRIKELIDNEDKKHPISDQDIVGILLREKNLHLSRRTVAKYRMELKILATSFRKER